MTGVLPVAVFVRAVRAERGQERGPGAVADERAARGCGQGADGEWETQVGSSAGRRIAPCPGIDVADLSSAQRVPDAESQPAVTTAVLGQGTPTRRIVSRSHGSAVPAVTVTATQGRGGDGDHGSGVGQRRAGAVGEQGPYPRGLVQSVCRHDGPLARHRRGQDRCSASVDQRLADLTASGRIPGAHGALVAAARGHHRLPVHGRHGDRADSATVGDEGPARPVARSSTRTVPRSLAATVGGDPSGAVPTARTVEGPGCQAVDWSSVGPARETGAQS
ncbi:hypothetical protein [Actinomadura kijaniata]|uniref:hypothetical protein n=1 Tax=Actinomadura kijaniata TaxID=46161 RepID=UPI000A78BF0F|nr:hypothetical protein [Actinomadura kijaniata]